MMAIRAQRRCISTAASALQEQNMTSEPTQFNEFDPLERNAEPPSAETAGLRELLRRSYQTPRDTYITEDIPLLMTRLSMVPGQH